jgi:hypothetical protein
VGVQGDAVGVESTALWRRPQAALIERRDSRVRGERNHMMKPARNVGQQLAVQPENGNGEQALCGVPLSQLAMAVATKGPHARSVCEHASVVRTARDLDHTLTSQSFNLHWERGTLCAVDP